MTWKAVVATMLAALPAAASASVVVLGFERVNPVYPSSAAPQILGFYAGGTSSAGTSGVNYGMSFDTNAVAVCLNPLAGSCSNASAGGLQPTSSQGALGLAADGQAVLDLAAAYTGPVAFRYAVAAGSSGAVALYSGAGGTGTLLGLVPLFPGAAGCPAYNAALCPLGPGGLGGTAILSVMFSGQAGRIVFDDLTFGAGNDPLPPPPVADVPEPGTWALMLAGFALTGTALRRRIVARPLAPRRQSRHSGGGA